MAELAAAVNGAPASGRQVLVAAGTYSGGMITLNRSGRAPVVVRPKDGPVTINGARWTLAAGSSRIVLAGLHFSDPLITVNGSNHRVTRCQVRRMGHFSFHLFTATDCRFDHCDVSDSISSKAKKAFVRLDGISVGKGACRRVLVDRNYIHHSTPAEGGPGSEIIGLHSGSNSAGGPSAGLVIECNLFEEVSLPGDGELIGAKCPGIIFRGNTMLKTGNPYVNAPRTAPGLEVRSNWFEGTKSIPLNVFARDGLVIGNRFMGALDCVVGAGNYYWADTGWQDRIKAGYPAADGRRVIGNRMGSGHIIVGGFWSGVKPPAVPARDVNLWGNTRDAGGDAHELLPDRQVGTTFKRDNEPFEPAVKLTPKDVGMSAPDPLCPSGPQS